MAGVTSWLLLCDLGQVTSLLSFPIRSHGGDETGSCLGAAPGFCIRPNRDGVEFSGTKADPYLVQAVSPSEEITEFEFRF